MREGVRIIIFIVKCGDVTPPRAVGGVWFRTYEDACAWIDTIQSVAPFQIEKWSVPAYADCGGTPFNEAMERLGVGADVNAWEKK